MATFHLSDSHLGDITMKIIPDLQLHPLTIHARRKNVSLRLRILYWRFQFSHSNYDVAVGDVCDT